MVSQNQISFAQYEKRHLWKNTTKPESGKLVAGQLHSPRSGTNNSGTTACFQTRCIGPNLLPPRADPGQFWTVWSGLSLVQNGMSDPAHIIQPDSGCMLAVTKMFLNCIKCFYWVGCNSLKQHLWEREISTTGTQAAILGYVCANSIWTKIKTGNQTAEKAKIMVEKMKNFSCEGGGSNGEWTEWLNILATAIHAKIETRNKSKCLLSQILKYCRKPVPTCEVSEKLYIGT